MIVAPELTSADFSAYLEKPTDEDSGYAGDVYDHLAGFCLQKLCELHPQFKRGSTRSGFRVVTRLVKFGAHLYPEYTEEQGVVARTEDLREILLNSVATPLRFAHLSRRTNNNVEHAFGLTSSRIPADIAELFHFEPNTSKGTLFIADDDKFAWAVSEGRAQDPHSDPSARCPMTEITRRVIWPGVVNLAAESPELFPHDLGLVAAAS